jgi:hypothetical protein
MYNTLKQNKNRYCAAKSTLETTRYKRLMVGEKVSMWWGKQWQRANVLKGSSVLSQTIKLIIIITKWNYYFDDDKNRNNVFKSKLITKSITATVPSTNELTNTTDTWQTPGTTTLWTQGSVLLQILCYPFFPDPVSHSVWPLINTVTDLLVTRPTSMYAHHAPENLRKLRMGTRPHSHLHCLFKRLTGGSQRTVALAHLPPLRSNHFYCFTGPTKARHRGC